MDEEGFLKLTNHKEHPTNIAYKVFFFSIKKFSPTTLKMNLKKEVFFSRREPS